MQKRIEQTLPMSAVARGPRLSASDLGRRTCRPRTSGLLTSDLLTSDLLTSEKASSDLQTSDVGPADLAPGPSMTMQMPALTMPTLRCRGLRELRCHHAAAPAVTMTMSPHSLPGGTAEAQRENRPHRCHLHPTPPCRRLRGHRGLRELRCHHAAAPAPAMRMSSCSRPGGTPEAQPKNFLRRCDLQSWLPQMASD